MCITTLIILGLLGYWLYKKYENGNLNIGKYFGKQEYYYDADSEYYKRKNKETQETDRILDKIKKVGYDNLTPKEKQYLKTRKK